MSNIFIFITYSGQKIFGELIDSDVKTGIMHVSYPILVDLSTVHTPAGFFTQQTPSLFQPFGDYGIIPFKADYFSSIVSASLGDERQYSFMLASLITQETKRRLILDSIFNEREYADIEAHDLYEVPETIQ